MKKRIAIAGGILALAALAAVPMVFAQGHMRRMHGMGAMGHEGGFGFFGGRHLARLTEELNLSPQQVEDIKAIFGDLHQQNAQYRQSMHGGFRSIAETLLEDPNDLAAAQALIDQQAATEKAMKTNMLNATSKALNVLTPEQRTQLAQKLAEHAARFEQHHQ